jgi:putative hydroxymethylpyrimidine transport system permease protein
MIGAVIVILLLLGAWEAYVELGGIDPLVLPAPHDVASTLWTERASLVHDLGVTAGEVALGILVAVVAGLVCAVAIHLSTTLRRALYPLLVASQTVPIVVIAPLLVVWLGFGLGPKLAIVGLVCFFPVTVTTLDALAAVDPALLKLMRTFGASRWQAFVRVEAPSALPGLLSGARIAVVVAVIAAVLAEDTGASSGLGYVVRTAGGQLDAPRAYAAVVLLSALAIGLWAALAALERTLIPWARGRPGANR